MTCTTGVHVVHVLALMGKFGQCAWHIRVDLKDALSIIKHFGSVESILEFKIGMHG